MYDSCCAYCGCSLPQKSFEENDGNENDFCSRTCHDAWENRQERDEGGDEEDLDEEGEEDEELYPDLDGDDDDGEDTDGSPDDEDVDDDWSPSG